MLQILVIYDIALGSRYGSIKVASSAQGISMADYLAIASSGQVSDTLRTR